MVDGNQVQFSVSKGTKVEYMESKTRLLSKSKYSETGDNEDCRKKKHLGKISGKVYPQIYFSETKEAHDL